MAPNVYVLQVGINQYPNGVGSLNGCVNDVHRIHDYITKTFGDSARTVQLFDSDANRKNVIKQFREHLGKAGAGDVVLFHYSGHGARWKSAPDFKKWFPEGWDEGLVLHDSRLPGGFDLADKEMAILLAEVAKNEPHITVLFDCCHSGSATRGLDDFTQLKVRQTHIAILKPSATIASEFLFLLMSTESVFRQAWNGTTGTAQPTLPLGNLRTIIVPLPPLSEQQEIVRRVEKLFAFADQIESRLQKAQSHVDRLAQSILAKAFRGELVPTEAVLAKR